MRVALYARVSTHDQTAENQLLELRRYVQARGWTAVEYVDTGVSGRKTAGPRSTSSLPMSVATVCKASSVGVSIASAETYGISCCCSMSGSRAASRS